jgi:hypothetical protein
MNINCPHCTAYLTVPEQYSGQLMKCPKCNSNFTVPALPPIDHEPAFAMAQSPPAPMAPPSPSMAPAIPPAPEVPAYNLAPPEPAFSHSPAPAPAPASPVAPAPSPRPAPTQTPKPSTPSAPPGTTTHSHHLPLSREILQWIAIAAVVLLFVLTFFPWVGVYPGGVRVVTQSAWGAAFGSESEPDPDMKATFAIVPEAEIKASNESRSQALKVAEPKANLLLIFYLLPFLLVTLLVSIAVAVLPFVHVQLPPAVANLLPWKWGILAVLNAVLLLFLALQLLLNFGIESSVKEAGQVKAESIVRGRKPSDGKEKTAVLNTQEQKTFDALKGIYSDWLGRTIWLKLVLVLHIIATAAAAMMYWMEKRGVNHLQLEWGARW